MSTNSGAPTHNSVHPEEPTLLWWAQWRRAYWHAFALMPGRGVIALCGRRINNPTDLEMVRSTDIADRTPTEATCTTCRAKTERQQP